MTITILLTLILLGYIAWWGTAPAMSATMNVLRAREHRQLRSLAHYQSTVRFFGNHPWLLKYGSEPNRWTARQELRRARAWVLIVTRELAETRAAMQPRYTVPAWWLPGAMCVHRGESGNWAIENPPYSGGMQMNYAFQRAYGPEFYARWGTAGHWPPAVQLLVAYRGWLVQGWGAWPNTSRNCGLR